MAENGPSERSQFERQLDRNRRIFVRERVQAPGCHFDFTEMVEAAGQSRNRVFSFLQYFGQPESSGRYRPELSYLYINEPKASAPTRWAFTGARPAYS